MLVVHVAPYTWPRLAHLLRTLGDGGGDRTQLADALPEREGVHAHTQREEGVAGQGELDVGLTGGAERFDDRLRPARGV